MILTKLGQHVNEMMAVAVNTDCVTASSVNMFKNKVDTYLRRTNFRIFYGHVFL